MPHFPDPEEVICTMSHGVPWHDGHYVKRTLAESGFTEIIIEECPNVQNFSKTAFLEGFGGSVVNYIARHIWGETEAAKFAKQLPKAVESYFEHRQLMQVEVTMVALVIVARNATTKSPNKT